MIFHFLLTSLLLSYSLVPGDGVYVKIFRHPEITDTFWVNQDTTLILPLVGEVDVAGIEYEDIDDSLVKWFSSYVKDPDIFVLPLFKVSVLGEVNKPGVYLVSSMDRIFEAIALAGGPTPKADLRRTRIRRGEKVLKINLRQAIEKGVTAYGVGLHSGDVIIVPRMLFPTWQELYFIMAAVAFGWSIYRTAK